jgi:hypothetical protein
MSRELTDDYRVALELLSGDPGDAAALLGSRVALAHLQRFREDAAPWLRSTKIQGFGIARRLADGRRSSSELALKVYVESKLPERRLTYPVPKRLAIPGLDVDVEFDVEPIGRLQTLGCPNVRRPALLGCSIGHVDGQTGTLGCLVRPKAGGLPIYLLSAAHVLAPAGARSVGGGVWQPAPGDCGKPKHRLAKLSRYTAISRGPGYPNQVDAAIAEIEHPGAISPDLGDLGLRPRGVANVAIGDSVRGVGRSTGVMKGEVRDPDFRVRLDYRRRPNETMRVGFRGQILCTHMSVGGDSGALVVDRKARAVGLLIAGNHRHSVLTPIQIVLQALGVQLA